MEIINLKLFNFRNFSKLDINFSNSKNIIIGNNGEGKTNIIESIFVLALTKSFRTTDENILVKKNNNLFKIEADVKSSFINNYKIIYQDEVKTVKINNKKVNKLSDYISNINIILYSINDLKWIKDTPSTRRKLMNLELSQFDNSYIKYLNYYNKLLKQRNLYIKTVDNNNINYNYINIIDEQLIGYGKTIMNMRNSFVEKLNETLTNIYHLIGGSGNLSISYESDFLNLSIEQLFDKFKKNIIKDLNMKSTQLGIHHDNFIFNINENDIKNFGSEGQQKLAVISFKLAELELFYNKNKEYPVLILDDLCSELDIKKIEKILNYINKDVQTFITTTDLKKIQKKYLRGSKIFSLSKNDIKEELYE